MDLLVEKLDGSRYYLSQYKVLITDFDESAPSVTRNSKQLDQRNGNIDFGGWHTDKTINITGYYRADDIDEEETLREKLYALLSDPNGYYITQLKTTPSVAMERPGETSGGYYDKLNDYPSHKRFLVYTEAPEMELVGNVNGTLLYKLTAEFKTMKLPYGESVLQDLDVKPNVPYYFSDVGLERDSSSQGISGKPKIDGKTPYLHTAYSWSADGTDRFTTVYPEENLILNTSNMTSLAHWSGSAVLTKHHFYKNGTENLFRLNNSTKTENYWYSERVNIEGGKQYTIRFEGFQNDTLTNYDVYFLCRRKDSAYYNDVVRPISGKRLSTSGTEVIEAVIKVPEEAYSGYIRFDNNGTNSDSQPSDLWFTNVALRKGDQTGVPYTPSPLDDPEGAYPTYIGTYTDYTAEDSTDPSKYTWALIKGEDGEDGLSGYNKWYFDTYYNTNNLAILYSGTVPCNQLEQGFAIELTAKEAASSLSLKIDDTELTYSGAVADGDVFVFSGFSYTQNGLSIVSKTNKAYFILQPDKPNRITCNVHGTVKIIGFQNLYA